MRKLNLIFVLIIVFVSVALSGAMSKGDKSTQLASAQEQIRFQTDGNQGDVNQLKTPEVFSESLISTSSEFLTNIRCGGDFEIYSRLALIRFLNDNNKIYELNVDSQWPLASITKLMTAIVASEHLGADKIITITDEMILAEGDSGNFKAGEKFMVSDLIKAMLMLSSNDAAEALARDFSYDNFMSFMNDKAKDLNMNSTKFFDPNGLSARNQSTPNDISKLVSYLYESRQDILKITATKSDYIVEQNTKIKKWISSNNEFAGQSDFIGGKTGFIDEAQGNLVSVFNYSSLGGSAYGGKKEPVAIIVLGSQDRFGDTRKLLQCLDSPEEINFEEINWNL